MSSSIRCPVTVNCKYDIIIQSYELFNIIIVQNDSV